MSIVLRKIKEDATTITLGWDPVPGCDGYVFYSAGVRRSKTMDPSRRSVRLSKGQEPYRVEAVRLTTIDYGEYPVVKPPPEPTYKKVAPRVAYKTDRADARYCLFLPGGMLRPGVTQRQDGKFTDESGAVYTDGDGLDESGRRSPGSANDCPTSASNIDGREYCSLPMQGDPTKNTGSWLI